VQQTSSPKEAIGEAGQLRDSRAKTLRALAPVFFYFLPAGAATVMLGPLLPALIHRWQILDAQAGALFTAHFLGQLCGAWFGTRNLRGSVLYGAALSAVGCVAMIWVNFAIAPIALFSIGVGLGLGLSAGNVIVGTAIPAARARLLAILNVAWSVGAIACPMALRLSAAGGVRVFFSLTAVCFALAALFAVAIPRGLKAANTARDISLSPTQSAGTHSSLPLWSLLVFAAALFLYVGVENSLGGWLPSYAVRSNPALRASSISFYFWAAELVVRLLMATLSVRIGEATLYRICLSLLLLIEVVLCTMAHLSPANMIALAVLSGLALAPLYPLLVAFMLARTGNHPRLGALFACASLGGAIMPWMTGIFSTQFHELRAGLLIPAVGVCLLLILSPAVTGRFTPTAQASL
jgi:FHS family glucose/mannose:H+ symporter-like MFS transporter